MPMPQDRSALRQALRERRRALPPATRINAAQALAGHILALPFLPREGYVAGYWAMDGEIGLHVLQLQLPAGLRWCLPVLDGDRLRFAPWRSGDPLVTNRFGIPEPDVEPTSALAPEAMALVVMPLVGFDERCQRLGMGGGWYDRSLAFRRDRAAPPWLVGAGFDVQQVDALDGAEWDVVPDAVCTGTRTLLRPGASAPHHETDPA